MNLGRLNFRTATREQLQCVWQAISSQTGDDRFFTTKELDVLPRELADYEQVLCFSSGFVDGNTWLIVLTDQRILLLDKGMFFGLKQISIELAKINSFQSETGLMFGSIEIGSNARNYSITNVWKKTVNPFALKMREAQRANEDRLTINAPGTEEALRIGGQNGVDETLPNQNSASPINGLEGARGSFTSILDNDSSRQAEIGDGEWLERLRAAGAITEQQYQAYKQQ